MRLRGNDLTDPRAAAAHPGGGSPGAWRWIGLAFAAAVLVVPGRSLAAWPRRFPTPRGTTRRRWASASRSPVRCGLVLLDVAGRRVRTIVNGTLDAGHHELRFDGMDEGRRRLAAGAYVVVLESNRTRAARRVVFVE